MIEIPLSQGKVAIIDEADFDRVSQYNWQAELARSGIWYAKTRIQDGCGRRKTVRLHQFILNANGAVIDHVDHDGLNNTRANLRTVTKRENRQNSRKRTPGLSSFKGVTWKSSHNKWNARITIEGKTKHLGYFDSEIEAATAYDAAARQHFQSFAHTNF